MYSLVARTATHGLSEFLNLRAFDFPQSSTPPATVRAVYSPSECPATKFGCGKPFAFRAAYMARLVVNMAG
ncbi:MAG: hypothetical protein NZ526_05645 [Aquificaceae bacterium]|nr:hypothetical protein [Aquificaceae bacterium]